MKNTCAPARKRPFIRPPSPTGDESRKGRNGRAKSEKFQGLTKTVGPSEILVDMAAVWS